MTAQLKPEEEEPRLIKRWMEGNLEEKAWREKRPRSNSMWFWDWNFEQHRYTLPLQYYRRIKRQLLRKLFAYVSFN